MTQAARWVARLFRIAADALELWADYKDEKEGR